MKMIPQEVTREKLLSSSVVDDFAAWDANTTYEVAELESNLNVALYKEHYYRAVATTTGDIPSDNEPSKWVKNGVSNTQAMFDLRSTTQTVSNADIIVEIDRELEDSLVIGNFEASTILIEVVDKTTGEVYETIEHNESVNELVFDFWDYIYAPYSGYSDRALYFTLGRYESGVGNTKVRITFVKDLILDTASCGYFIMGEGIDMGETLAGVNFSFNSFSTKETDSYGIISINKRAAQDLVDFETKVPRNRAMRTKSIAKQRKDDIVAFVVDESQDSEFDNMITLGTTEDVSTVVSSMNKTTLNWSISETI